MNADRTPSPRWRGEGWGEGPSARRQRGVALLLMLLVVALIILFLAKDAMLAYLGPVQKVERAQPRTQFDPAAPDPTTASPTPGNAVERARNLQDTLQKESEKRGTD